MIYTEARHLHNDKLCYSAAKKYILQKISSSYDLLHKLILNIILE